jgi:hypothetical protein
MVLLEIGPMAMEADWLPVSKSLLTCRVRRTGLAGWRSSIACRRPAPRARLCWRDRQRGAPARQLIDRAVKPLLPFGVKAEDLHALVQRRLEERWGLLPEKAA